MPTVIKVEGYRVKVYTRDEHPPAHVHVEKTGGNIKIMLGDDEVTVHSYKGDVQSAQVMRAAEIVAENLEACWECWRRFNP